MSPSMLAADKVHKDSDKKGQDPSKPGPLALCQGQVFADRINRFKKAAGLAVSSTSVKKARTQTSLPSKSNLCERGDIQGTFTDKYDIQRAFTDKCNTQRTFTDKYDTQRTCTDARVGSDVGDGVRGTTYTCNETAELRRRLQDSHNRQRLMATLAYAEQERKESECGYRMSSNGVLVSTRKADVYTDLHLLPTGIEDGNTLVVVESDDSAGESDTYTDYEEEEVEADDKDYNMDASRKSSGDSLEICKKTHVNTENNVYTRNTSSRLPKEKESVEERCSKNIPGGQLKAYYIFDSADMECYDHFPGKSSFVPNDYIGNYKVQGIQLRQLTDTKTKLMRSAQQDAEKEIVPVLVISENMKDADETHNEKTKVNENNRLETLRDPVEEQQDTRLVTESLEDKESQDFTSTLENEDVQSIAALEDANTNKEVTPVLEYQDKRLETESLKYEKSTKNSFLIEHQDIKLQTEALKYGESMKDTFLLEHQDTRLETELLKYGESTKDTFLLEHQDTRLINEPPKNEECNECTSVLFQHGRKSIKNRLECEDDSERTYVWNHQTGKKDNQELHSGPHEVKYILESQNVEHQEVEFDSLSERYIDDKQDVRYALELQEECIEIQKTKSVFEPQLDAKNKQEVGSMLPSQGSVAYNPTIECELVSHGNFEEPQEVKVTSEMQEDTAGFREVECSSETSEDVKGDSNSISDVAETKCIFTSHDDSDETRGDGCVYGQHAGFEDTNRAEPFKIPQHHVRKYQNVECNSLSLQKLDEQKQGDDKRREQITDSTTLKKMGITDDKQLWVVYDLVEHEKLENATEQSKHIHSTQESTAIQKNAAVVNASSQVSYVQGENVEQEQDCDVRDASHASCNDEYEYEIVSEDDNGKESDLDHQLVFFEEYHSGDRKYTSPYSKFHRLHEDLVKGLTCPSESDDGVNSSDCQYEYNEQDEEETEEEKEEDNTVGCDPVPSDKDWRENTKTTIQILNPLNLSVARCENKLKGQCDVKNSHVPSDAMKHGVQSNSHMTSEAVEGITTDADHGLQSCTSSTEDNKDHIQAGASEEVRALDYGEKIVVPIDSDKCQSKEAFTLQVVQSHKSHASPASTDSSFTREDGVAAVYCLGNILRSFKADKEDQFDQRDNYVDKDKEDAPGLTELQRKVDKCHIEIENNNSTLVSLVNDSEIQGCFNCRARQSTRTSASILRDDSGESISPRYSTIDIRSESIKQKISQTSSRSKCCSSQQRHTDVDIPPKCNNNMSSSGTDDMSCALCMVQPSKEEFTTSTDQYGLFCNSMQPSESHVSVTAHNVDSININETYLNYAGSSSYDSEFILQCEVDDNKQYRRMVKNEACVLQDVAVNNITNENLFLKASMVELVTPQELRCPSTSHTGDSEPCSLASSFVSIGSLTGHDLQQREQNEALNENLAAHVNDTCIGWKTVSHTATESFTELVVSSSSGSEVGLDGACLDVLDVVDRVDKQNNTAVCSAQTSHTIEHANQINSFVISNTGKSGNEICEETTIHTPCHNSGAGRNANSRLSGAKMCPYLAYSDVAVYEKAGNSAYVARMPTTTITARGGQGSEMKEVNKKTPFVKETNNDDISASDLDLLPQRIESSHIIAASGDFTTSTMTTIKQDADNRLRELACIQRETCVNMMKNVLSRAEKSKKLDSTSKTVPVIHPEKKDQCPLFCMVTGSKIEACHRTPASKATCSSGTHIAPTRLKPIQQPQKPQVRLHGRNKCRTLANSSNVNQKRENLNRRNRSLTYERLFSKTSTEGSMLAKDVNVKQDRIKPLHQCNGAQNMANLKPDQKTKKSMLKQGHSNEKHSFVKPAAYQENDFKHSEKCNDQLPVSKIPRLVKTCAFSQAKYTQENRNANYSEVNENLTQPCNEASEARRSVSQQIHRASVVHKDICVCSESDRDELIFTDAPKERSETTNLGSSSRCVIYEGTRHISEEHSRYIVTHPSAAERVLNQGHSSEQRLCQNSLFGGKSTDNYFNNVSAISAHVTGDVLSHEFTKYVSLKNSQEIQREQLYSYSRGKLDNVSNHDGRNQSQQTLCETDRSVSVQQSPITKSQQALCETDRSMYAQQCPITQAHQILCETPRSVCGEQCPIIQQRQKLCEAGKSGIAKQTFIPQSHETSYAADRAVSVMQSSKPIMNSTRNEHIIDPTCGSQHNSTDYQDKQFEHLIGDIHLPWDVAEDKSYSLFGLLPIERKQDLCWNNQSELTSEPVKVEAAENLASNTPTIHDANEVFPTAIKEKHSVHVNTEATVILSNTNVSWDNTRAGAKPTEYSSYDTKQSTTITEDHNEPVNNHDMYEVSIDDMINSDNVCINMHECKLPAANSVTFKSMIKNLMNQSEELTSDSENDPTQLFINERQKRNESIFPMSLSENNKCNWEEEMTYKRVDHDPEKGNIPQKNQANIEAATCSGGADKPTYAELKFKALSKVLPVLGKLKLQPEKYMQIDTVANSLPFDSCVQRTTSELPPNSLPFDSYEQRTTSELPIMQQSVNATSLTNNSGTDVKIFTDEEAVTKEAFISKSGTFMKELTNYNSFSGFNINNSKSDQGVDKNKDNAGTSQENSGANAIICGVDQVNLVQKDMVSVTSRDPRNTHQYISVGKPTVRRKCRIPVRQNNRPCVLPEKVEISDEKHLRKPRNIIMVLKSKNKRNGNVAAALSLVQPADSSTSNAADTKHDTELPKHVQVFAKGNEIVVEVCADSSSTAASVSTTEKVRAPLAERIRKYQQTRPRNILAGRNHTQEESALENASKLLKKVPDNMSSCSEVLSIPTNSLVQTCKIRHKYVKSCIGIDKARESDVSSPRSSKTFNVYVDEDTSISHGNKETILAKVDSVSQEDVAIQTSDNTLATPVTVPTTYLQIHKKDVAEQTSISSSNKSNSGAEELNVDATVTDSKSLGEDCSYNITNSKTSESLSMPGSLIKAKRSLSSSSKQYLKKNVAFSSKLMKTEPDFINGDNSGTCRSKHTVATLQRRYQHATEKSTKIDTTTAKRQQRYKKLERPARLNQTTKNATCSNLSQCQLFSPSSQESNERILQQDPATELESQSSLCINIQNVETDQQHLQSNSRISNTIDEQDICKQQTIVTNFESDGDEIFLHVDDEKFKSAFDDDEGLQNGDRYPSSNCRRIDESKLCKSVFSSRVCNKGDNNLVPSDDVMPDSGTQSPITFISSRCELAEPKQFQKTQWAARNQDSLLKNIDSNCSLKTPECAASLSDSNKQRTKNPPLALTVSSKLNLQECSHSNFIPHSGVITIQMMNNDGDSRQVNYARDSMKTSQTDCDGLEETHVTNESGKLTKTDNYETVTQKRTTDGVCNISVTDCASTTEEAIESNILSVSDSCHALAEEILVNDSKYETHPSYKNVMPSAFNKQKENTFFNPIPATVSPKISIKHPKVKSLLIKSMTFTAEDSSSKSSLRSNENGNAHIYVATRKPDCYNPLSLLPTDTQDSLVDNTNITPDICLRGGTTPDKNLPATNLEWQTDTIINHTSETFENVEHTQVYLPQAHPEIMSRRSKSNNKTPRLPHSRNNLSACLQPHTPDVSAKQVKILETMSASPGVVNEGRLGENTDTPYDRHSLSLPVNRDNKQKASQIISTHSKHNLGSKTSNTLELVAHRSDLFSPEMPSVMATDGQHKGMTTPRKGKITFVNQQMEDYGGLSPGVITSRQSLNYSTTSQESVAERQAYSSQEQVTTVAGQVTTSNNTERQPLTASPSARHRQSSRASDEKHNSDKPKLPPLSSRQSGLPHRPHFKRYY